MKHDKSKKTLGRKMYCPKCKQLVWHVRGPVPTCPKCGSEVQPIA